MKRLERKVETLNVSLAEERKINTALEKDAERRIEELNQKLRLVQGGERLKFQEELKKVKESKERLADKQRELEREIRNTQSMIKKEEQDAKVLEDETKREEVRKQKLMELHKMRMRELRRKIMDSIANQNVTHNAITEEEVGVSRGVAGQKEKPNKPTDRIISS
jgi:tRNA U34 5-carboxymethylaminomethyl modifying enzyme MnmG/GidA